MRWWPRRTLHQSISTKVSDINMSKCELHEVVAVQKHMLQWSQLKTLQAVRSYMLPCLPDTQNSDGDLWRTKRLGNIC